MQNFSKISFHFRNIHQMNLKPLKKQPIFYPAISAKDTNDPNNTSCDIYKLTYGTKDYYRKHMDIVHKKGRSAPNKRLGSRYLDPNITLDSNDPDFCCSSCQRQYSSRESLCHHIRSYHKKSTSRQIKVKVEEDVKVHTEMKIEMQK